MLTRIMHFRVEVHDGDLTAGAFNLVLGRLSAFGEGALDHRRSGSRWEREGTPLRLFYSRSGLEAIGPRLGEEWRAGCMAGEE